MQIAEIKFHKVAKDAFSKLNLKKLPTLKSISDTFKGLTEEDEMKEKLGLENTKENRINRF